MVDMFIDQKGACVHVLRRVSLSPEGYVRGLSAKLEDCIRTPACFDGTSVGFFTAKRAKLSPCVGGRPRF